MKVTNEELTTKLENLADDVVPNVDGSADDRIEAIADAITFNGNLEELARWICEAVDLNEDTE